MAGNDFYVGRGHAQNLFAPFDHAADGAAAVGIDERKAVSDKIVSHVDDISLGKKDDAVAIRMAVRKMNGPNILAIYVHARALAEIDHRQAFLGGRFPYSPVTGAALLNPVSRLFIAHD